MSQALPWDDIGQKTALFSPKVECKAVFQKREHLSSITLRKLVALKALLLPVFCGGPATGDAQ